MATARRSLDAHPGLSPRVGTRRRDETLSTTQGAGNTAYVSSSTITHNATGVSATGGASIVSGLDNWLVGNTTDGTFSSGIARQ